MMRGTLVALSCLAACGDNFRRPFEFDHDVQAADVSILYPLPDSRDRLISPAEHGVYGPLFPESLFPTAIGPVDVGIVYTDMRLIALRFDPCSARNGCSSEARAIFQPVVVAPDGGLTVADGAIHVFYEIPQDELTGFLIEVLALKKAFGEGVAYGRVLGPHPILVAEGLDGSFANQLHEVILEHLGEARIQRYTERNHQIPLRDRWDFYLFERSGDSFVRKDIATANTDEQQVTGTPPDPKQPGGIEGVNPVLTSPVVAVVSETRPAAITDEIRTGFARAIELQNPTKENSESIDCVSCHLAEGAHLVGVTEYGLVATSPFQHARSLEYRRDLSVVTNLHIFAYDGRAVSVTQRVANESAVTADAMQALVNASGP